MARRPGCKRTGKAARRHDPGAFLQFGNLELWRSSFYATYRCEQEVVLAPRPVVGWIDWRSSRAGDPPTPGHCVPISMSWSSAHPGLFGVGPRPWDRSRYGRPASGCTPRGTRVGPFMLDEAQPLDTTTSNLTGPRPWLTWLDAASPVASDPAQVIQVRNVRRLPQFDLPAKRPRCSARRGRCLALYGPRAGGGAR